ncbi:MAG: hypothetical protein ACI9P5_004823 [Saprospiraceae bacterium]|jgi:hypothetical protein
MGGTSIDEWEEWYKERHPKAIDNATEKVFGMIELLKEAIVKIDKGTVRNWVEDLVIIKTFTGLKFQEAILKRIALDFELTYRLAEPNEESRGIDGFIGDHPVSIKPKTYGAKLGLNELIEFPIIYYEKKKTGLYIEFDESTFN